MHEQAAHEEGERSGKLRHGEHVYSTGEESEIPPLPASRPAPFATYTGEVGAPKFYDAQQDELMERVMGTVASAPAETAVNTGPLVRTELVSDADLLARYGEDDVAVNARAENTVYDPITEKEAIAQRNAKDHAMEEHLLGQQIQAEFKGDKGEVARLQGLIDLIHERIAERLKSLH